MAVLSDGEIRTAIEEGRLTFEPQLDEEYLEVALTTSALDLRLGSELHFYKSLEEVAPKGLADAAVIDPSKPGVIPDLIQKWGRKHSIADSYYDLPSGEFVLGTTFESITLPEEGRVAARVEGKSTLARLGFVAHMTAPTIHSGFDGKIILEMYNFGPYPIRLADKMRVCQLIFEELGELPVAAQATQYQGQTGPA